VLVSFASANKVSPDKPDRTSARERQIVVQVVSFRMNDRFSCGNDGEGVRERRKIITTILGGVKNAN
jgi:hypothetical protein